MSEIFRTGSEDQVLGPTHDIGEDPPVDEDRPDCDSGRSSNCSGHATVTLSVPYLREPLRLCQECAAYEARQTEDGPNPLRTPGVEGGVSFDYLRR